MQAVHAFVYPDGQRLRKVRKVHAEVGPHDTACDIKGRLTLKRLGYEFDSRAEDACQLCARKLPLDT